LLQMTAFAGGSFAQFPGPEQAQPQMHQSGDPHGRRRMFLARLAETFFEFGGAATLQPRTIGAEGHELADAPAGVFFGAGVRARVPDRLDALADAVSQSPQDANGKASESLVKSFQSDPGASSLAQRDGTERFGGLE